VKAVFLIYYFLEKHGSGALEIGQQARGGSNMGERRMLGLIDTAIEREEAAYRFYTDLFGMVTDQAVKETLLWIAEEEKKHKAFLVQYRSQGGDVAALRDAGDVMYYRIAEYLEEPDVSKEMTRADLFLVASHREARSHRFYLELAQLHPEGEIRRMLEQMAGEELGHKEKMEYLYTNTAFPQTDGG
jgi:rubrerythrin